MSPRRNLRRFEKLEREREASPSVPSAPAAGNPRFESLQTEAAVPSAFQASGAALGRFEAPEDRPLALLDKRAGDQPFARCARCEADNSRFVDVCARCGERLDTPEQRAFNEALWAERRQVQQAEQAQHEVTKAAQGFALEEEARAKRAYFEALARQVGEETRARLDEPDVFRTGLPLRVRRHLTMKGGLAGGVTLGAAFFGCASLALVAVGGPGLWLRLLPVLLLFSVGIGLRSAKFK